MWKFLVPFFITSFVVCTDAQLNWAANAVFDSVIESFRTDLDPMVLNDTKHEIKYSILFTLHFGSIEWRNTTITGLKNLTRVGDIDVSLENGITGLISLGVPDVQMTSILNPSIGGIIQIGYPLPMHVNIEYMQINFKVVADITGSNPRVKKLKIEKFENVEVNFDYGPIVRPFSFMANRIMNESIIKLLNGVIKRRLERTMKKNINESIKDFSPVASFWG